MTKKTSKGAARPAGKTKKADVESSKIAKTQIVEAVATSTGLTKKQAGGAVDAMLETVLGALKGGKSVGLPGLGTLSVRATAARTGVRPGTSDKIQIPAGKKVAFKVASALKGEL